MRKFTSKNTLTSFLYYILIFVSVCLAIFMCFIVYNSYNNNNNKQSKNNSKDDLIHPITFSIPKEKIVRDISKKERMLASIIPGDVDTYIYNDEKEYYHGYQISMFAKTHIKSGWDCMRHYEIMANGCIPYFPGIEDCPEKTMYLFPKDLIKRGNELYSKYGDKKIEDLSNNDIIECNILIYEILNYVREKLTTECIAKYVLEKSNHEKVSNILFLSGDILCDYLKTLSLNGFKQLFNTKCHDYPKNKNIYEGEIGDYGKGFSYSGLIPHEYHDDKLDMTVEEDIKNKKYDLIIYGSYHRGMPHYELVQEHYAPENIVLLCGEDIHNCDYSKYTNKGHHVFVRELV